MTDKIDSDNIDNRPELSFRKLLINPELRTPIFPDECVECGCQPNVYHEETHKVMFRVDETDRFHGTRRIITETYKVIPVNLKIPYCDKHSNAEKTKKENKKNHSNFGFSHYYFSLYYINLLFNI